MPTIVTHRQVSIRAAFQLDEWTTDGGGDFGRHGPRPDHCATPPDDEAGTTFTSLPDRRKRTRAAWFRRWSLRKAITRRKRTP